MQKSSVSLRGYVYIIYIYNRIKMCLPPVYTYSKTKTKYIIGSILLWNISESPLIYSDSSWETAKGFERPTLKKDEQTRRCEETAERVSERAMARHPGMPPGHADRTRRPDTPPGHATRARRPVSTPRYCRFNGQNQLIINAVKNMKNAWKRTARKLGAPLSIRTQEVMKNKCFAIFVILNIIIILLFAICNQWHVKWGDVSMGHHCRGFLLARNV